jgi:hypothetical protein
MVCGSCENWHFRGMRCPHYQGGMNQWARNISSNQQLNHTAKKHYLYKKGSNEARKQERWGEERGWGGGGHYNVRQLRVMDLLAVETVVSITPEQGLHSHVDLMSSPESFWKANRRLPWFAEINTTLSVNTVRVDFNLNALPNNVVHVSGFCGEDKGTVKLIVVSLVDTVFSYGRLVRIFLSDVVLMFL